MVEIFTSMHGISPKYCFESFDARNSCEKRYDDLIFFKCAHCDAKLCMEHLFDDMHLQPTDFSHLFLLIILKGSPPYFDILQ